MTGPQLAELMQRLNLSGADLAEATGYSRQYIWLLVNDAGDIGDTPFEKIRSALLDRSQDAAQVFFELAGGEKT